MRCFPSCRVLLLSCRVGGSDQEILGLCSLLTVHYVRGRGTHSIVAAIIVLTPAAGMTAGTQTTWASLMQIPNSVLNAATGVPESTFSELKKYPLVIAPGTGGEACMAKCNIDFKTVSAVSHVCQRMVYCVMLDKTSRKYRWPPAC